MTDSTLHSTDRRTRIVTELKKFAAMTLYLWCAFQLFAIYRALVLKQQGLDSWEQTFAIINALVFAKVIMTGQLFNLGGRLRKLPIVYTALGNALGFATVILLFTIAEHVIKAALKGLPLAEAFADVGGGSLVGLLALETTVFIALFPFFALQEIARVLGASNVSDLFFTRDKDRYKLIRQ